MAITLKDIARECGLAVSSVSNILNNNATSFASAEVRQKVREAAERLGYKKDYLSSSLRTRKTRSVGLIVDQIDAYTRQDFLVPFVEQFSSQGFEVALAEHRNAPERAVAALQGYTERYKDGIVLFTDVFGDSEGQARLRAAVETSSTKILGIGSQLRGLIPSLDIDRGHAVESSIEGFFAQGRRRVLMVYEYEWDMRPSFRYWNHPELTFWGGVRTADDFLTRARGVDWHSFDAAFFRTDQVAIPALRYLRRQSIRVPQDLAVVGFDNFPFSEQTVPALSTWDIGFHRLGERAQQHLATWMAGTGLEKDHYESFRPSFVARESHGSGLGPEGKS